MTKTDAGNHTSNYAVDLSQSAKDSLTKADSALQSWTAQVNGADVKVVNQTNNTVNFVNGTNTVVSADASGNISVSTAENVTFNTVNASTFNAGDVSISNNGINAGGKTVTNVANGTKDSDAVNLSQLNATNTNVANNAQNITNNANNITNNTNAIANNTQNITNNTNAINKGINFGNGTKANNFALGSTINVTSDSNLVVSTVTDGVKLTLADSIAVGNVTVNDTFKAGNVTINNSGIDAGNHAITNVTAGTNATDAVNVAQLEANTTRYYSVNSTATGNRKNDGATGANAMAAGANATASGDNATAIGQGTKANSAAAIAIGNNANATSSSNDSVIAIGNNAQSTGSYSIAVGTNSVASNTWSMAMGISAKATGDYATGLGSNAQATAQWTTALGAGANATESAATAVGSNATAGADGATVIGYNSSVTGANTTALGNNINVSTEGSVVLGNNSAAATATTETAATVNNLTYSGFAGAGNVAAGDYVSVGSAGQERQIKYVAPGNISATSTDAINGSQLYATNRVLGNVANSVVNNFGGNAAVDSNGNITFTDIGGTGETTIHDAIKNVSDVANTGWNVQTNGDTATKVAPGDTVQFKDGKNIKITRTEKDITVATADDVSFNSINTSTLTAGPVTINSNGIDAGNKTITNVAAGTNGTDAVNLDQLNQTISANAYNWNISDGTNKADVPDNSTVAIKGSANGDSAKTAGIVTALDGTNVSVDLSEQTKSDIQQGVNANTTVSKGFNIGADNGNDDNVQLGETVNYNGDSNIITTVSNNAIAFALNSSIAVDNVTVNDTFKAGDVTINNNGIDAGNHAITNVTAGTNATDAVNVAQLNASQSSVKAGDNVNVTSSKDANGTVYTVNANTSTVSNGSDKVTVTKTDAGNHTSNYAVDLSDAAKSSLTKADSALQSWTAQVNGADVKVVNQTNNTVNFVNGTNTVVSADASGNISVSTAENVTFNTVNASTFNAGDVSISNNGINAGGKVVTNVANGTQDSDAVNLSQLNATNANVANNAQNITNNANNISNNTKAIANNTQNITTNANNIAANTAAIKQGFNIGADNGNDDNVQLGETVNYNGDSNIITTVSDNAIAFALNSSIAVDNVTVNNTFKAGDVTINNSGIDAGNHTITNVTAGTNATDAVNLGQLNASKSQVKSGDNTEVTSTSDANGTVYTVNANTSTVSNGSDKVTVTKTNAGNHTSNYAVDLSDAAKSSLTKADSALQSLTTSADGNQAQTLNQENSNANFISGNNIQLTPSANGITVATKADVTFTNVTATNVNGNTVTIGSGANTTTLTSTAEGLDVGGDKLTNISAGTNKTDAVNLGQLEKYIGDNSYNWNLSDGTNNNAVADNSTVAIKGSANADSAKTVGIVTALDGTNVSVDLSDKTKSDIQQGVDANTTVNNKGITFAADSGAATERKLGETLTVNGDGDLINTTASAGKIEVAATDKLKNAVTNATSALQSVVTQIDGKDVKTLNKADNKANFVSGDNISLTNDGQGGIKIATKENVTFNTVNASTFNAGDVSISSNGINAGGKTVTNVANGTKDSDAVNLSQLNASTSANAWKITGNNAANATTVGNETVSFNNGTNTVAVVSDTNVTFDLADNIKLTKDGSMTIGTTVITNGNIKVGNNVAVTETGFTAGNVSVTTSGINAGGKTITNVARGVADDDAVNVSQLNEVKATANAGWNLTANGQNSSNVAPNATVDLANKDGNINITKSGNNVAFDLSDKLNIGSGANTVVIDGTTGKVSAGNVSIGKDGISAGGQTITNVAPGVNGTDAVNVDQLRNFTSSVVDKPLTFAGDTGTPSERKMGSTVTVKGGVSDTTKLTDNNIGVVSDGQGSLNVKLAKDLTGLNSVTISNGSASTKLTTVTKKNVEGKEASALDVGGNQITNVAPGEVSKDSTDAVNGSQLHATNQQVIRNANAINQVAGQVHSVDRKLRAGVAGALASGGLYHATMPGKSMVAAGAGTYRGESAIAVGYSRLSDNGKLGVKFSVNSNTRGDTGAAASVGYQW
ncbi:YadA-like family protein [Bisgaard Taxon 10/6]|uniref:YadA-like family protein n=1 Tax=Exercitatus varius TaxID=67857 RepID=UPI00294B6CD0|nr:YadA-like family protein [Exercitatus varius]MDG2938604.1 YadA-like family protein [Exercitatus varius]